MKTKNTLKRLPVKESVRVVETLGGSAEVGRICGVSLSAVSQWKSNGIPRAQFLFLRERFKNLPIMKERTLLDF